MHNTKSIEFNTSNTKNELKINKVDIENQIKCKKFN